MFCGDGWCGLFCRLNGIAGALEKTEGKYKQVSSKGESGLVKVGKTVDRTMRRWEEHVLEGVLIDDCRGPFQKGG